MLKLPHRLLLLQQRTLVRARLGQSAGTDMQRFKEEGEHVCSSVWHQVALCSPDTQQQLAGFQSSVASLSVIPLTSHIFSRLSGVGSQGSSSRSNTTVYCYSLVI